MSLRRSLMLRLSLGALTASTLMGDPSLAAAAPAAPGTLMPATAATAPVSAASTATQLIPNAPVTNQGAPRSRPVFVRVFICVQQPVFVRRVIPARVVFVRQVVFVRRVNANRAVFVRRVIARRVIFVRTVRLQCFPAFVRR